MQHLSHNRYFGEDSAQAIHAHPRKTACTWFSSWSWLPTCDAHFGPKHPMKQCCCSQPRSLSNVPVLRYLVCTWMHRLVLKHFGCEPMNQAYVKWEVLFDIDVGSEILPGIFACNQAPSSRWRRRKKKRQLVDFSPTLLRKTLPGWHCPWCTALREFNETILFFFNKRTCISYRSLPIKKLMTFNPTDSINHETSYMAERSIPPEQ